MQPQRPFNPRFSTGDPGFGDLSFWQFLAQEDFSGGNGQRIFSDKTKYLRATGWDVRNRDGLSVLSLAFGQETPTTAAQFPTLVPGTSRAVTPKVIIFGNDVYVAYPTGAATFTRTQIVARNAASNRPNVYHINSHDIAVWSRLGDITAKNVFLMVVNGTTIRAYNEAYTQIFEDIIASSNYRTIIPVSGDEIQLLGMTGADNGIMEFKRINFTSGTWTVSGRTTTTMDGGLAGECTSWAAKDSDSVFYFASSDMTEALHREPSRIIRFTSADMSASSQKVSSVFFTPDMIIRGLFDLNGSVYYFGAEISGDEARDVIYKFPKTLIYRSPKGKSVRAPTTGTNPNIGITSVFQQGHRVLFMSENGMNDGLVSVMALGLDDKVTDIAAFSPAIDSSGTVYDPRVIFEFYGLIYSGRITGLAAGSVVRTGPTRGKIPIIDPAVELSDFGANTPLIRKSLYSILVELSKAIPSGGLLSFFVNDALAATMRPEDGLDKELLMVKETVGPSFRVKISANKDTDWSGYLKRIVLKYFPVQFKKKSWSFVIRMDNSLGLLSGQRETRSPIEMLFDVVEAWSSNLPVDFIDLDGQKYKVIITDFKGRVPIISDLLEDREFLCPIEILEV